MNKPADFTDAQKAVLNMTAQTIGKDLLSALIDEIRTLPDVWQKLSQAKQADIIERVSKRVDYNVKRAVHLIASDGRIVVAGDVEQIVIKDEAKAVVKFSKNAENLHQLFDCESKAVLVVVANSSDFTGGMDEVQADPDQTEFDLHDGDKAFVDAGEAEIVDDELIIDAEILALPHSLSNNISTDDDGNIIEAEFKDSDWFKALVEIAGAYGENVYDADDNMWLDHSIDKTPQEAFFEVYPDHKPADEADND